MATYFTFFEDAGHGWLRVEKSLLQSLNIADKISSSSFVDKSYIYLEEDLDFSIFILAYARFQGIVEQEGERFRSWLQNFWNDTLREEAEYHEYIRNLPNYSV